MDILLYEVSAQRGDAHDAYLNAQGLSIPMAELEKLGVLHPKLTGAQRRLYVEFGKSGRLLTLDGVAAIETRALIEVGVPKRLAHRLVRTALDDLTATTGITMPRNIPWVGPNSKGVV
jgi:hypothetical protein